MVVRGAYQKRKGNIVFRVVDRMKKGVLWSGEGVTKGVDRMERGYSRQRSIERELKGV